MKQLSNCQNPEEHQILERTFRSCLKSSVWDFTSGYRGGSFFDLDELSLGAETGENGKVNYSTQRGLQHSRKLINLFAQKLEDPVRQYSVERLAFIDSPMGPVGMLQYKNTLAELLSIETCIVRPRKRLLHATVKGEAVHAGEIFAVVSDLATTGASIYSAAKPLIDLGGKVPAAFIIFDRQQGARENLSAVGITLYALVHHSEAVECGWVPSYPHPEPVYRLLGEEIVSY